MFNLRPIFKVVLVSFIVSITNVDACSSSPTIRNSKELEAIQECDEIFRDLKITSEFDGALSLPNLDSVYNDFIIDGAKIKELDFENLEKVGGKFSIEVHNLEKLQLKDEFGFDQLNIKNVENIETLNFTLFRTNRANSRGSIELSVIKTKHIRLNGESINSIKLDSISGLEDLQLEYIFIKSLVLNSVSGIRELKLNFKENNELKVNVLPDIKSIEIPEFKRGEKIEISNNPQLESIVIPNIENINEILIYNNPMLKSIFLPKITKASNIQIYKNPVLETLSLVGLTESEFLTVKDCHNIKSIDFPSLSKLSGSGDFEDHPKATINMPNLEYVEKILSFFDIKDINIPKIKKMGSFRYKFISTHNLNLQNLEEVVDFIHISSNDNLISINFPILSQVREGEFTIEKNKLLNEIEIPNLIYVYNFKIDQPKINDILFNKGIRGEKLEIDSMIKCDKIKKIKFHFDDCRNPEKNTFSIPTFNNIDTPEKTKVDNSLIQNPNIKKNEANIQEASMSNTKNVAQINPTSSNAGVIDYQENTPTSNAYISTATLFGLLLTSVSCSLYSF